ncbi:hypothetical protein [Tersicoccus sp. Bi-70]|uniref:hypothetical protein n=1 Tax=Tersicoccus sp. Bi-70 TaxID=1897634 RepID=UPI00117BFCD6|nr:hypothetical protein [Tersicoccus sp. Bi-70]
MHDSVGPSPVPPVPAEGSVDVSRPFSHRRRNRHGRGMRSGPLPLGAPVRRTRADVFDDAVLDSAQRLQRLHRPALDAVSFAVQQIPDDLEQLRARATGELLADGGIPMGRLDERDGRVVIVVFRRVVEQFAGRDIPLADAVHDAIVELVASWLHWDPEAVDPHYGRFD